MTDSTVRIGFVGAGFIARAHALGIGACDGAVAHAVANPSEGRRAEFARDFSIARTYSTAEELIGDPEVDAVILSTPNVFHASHAIAAFEAGKDVFVEKPMACTTLEAEAIVAAAEKSGRTLMVGHMWRFDPEVLYLRKKIESGAVGRIFRTTAFGVHVDWGPEGWFTSKDLACGGAIADMGIHAIDTTRYLIGDPNPVRVYANIGRYTGRVPEVDDTGIIFIEWDNGVVSTIEAGWWQPYSEGPEAAARLYGDGGFAALFPTHVIGGEPEARTEERPAFPVRDDHCPQSIYTDQMKEFVAAVRDERAVVPGGAEGLMNVRIVEAAYKAAQTHTVIEL